ncbi:hypothetical protein DY000_02055670 [Brassica cretica]|uniref:Reverse transcriptase zinc-binding domain-containing protein n=1 Tax=Brassica cretica TaxID=69181 RepID=A0ABQ7AIP3_BRACR|nr:hypothetical protein DY000_02055670 [Brassica cretica]
MVALTCTSMVMSRDWESGKLLLWPLYTLMEIEEDSYEWVINGKSRDKFATGSVYAYLKGDVATVAWSSLVWSSYGIPRQNFLTWLVIQNRCPTKDRLLSWGLQVDSLCPLYNVGQESRNHLFFDCSFSFQIWSVMAARCGFQARPNWDETVISLQNFRGNKNLHRLLLLAWQSPIYSIWKERRNMRIHQQVFRSTDAIITLLDRLIRNQIQSLRESRPRQASLLMQLWFSTE